MAYSQNADPWSHDQLDSRAERDKINEALRASDQWRNAIKAMGLNPDGPLKLTKQQQQRLAATLGLNTSDFHIDPAGNINDYHGWKGLPTAAKVAIIAGATVATAGAAGAFSGPAAEMAVTTTAGGGVPAATGGALTASGAVAGGGMGSGLGTSALVAGGEEAARRGTMSKIGGEAARYGIPAVGEFLTSAFGSSRAAQDQERQRQFDREQQDRALEAQRLRQQELLGYNRDRDLQQTALDESKLDPWRHTMSQVGDASKLDRVANASYTPVHFSQGQGGQIQRTGGASYQKSPELIQAAKMAAALVLSGRGQAPSMTNPANYGQTGVTDLTGGGGRPGPVARPNNGAPVSTGMPVNEGSPWSMDGSTPTNLPPGSQTAARPRPNIGFDDLNADPWGVRRNVLYAA